MSAFVNSSWNAKVYAKAALVDRQALANHQANAELVDAEECLKDAFASDVRPILREWRESRGLAAEPLRAYRESGYTERITSERAERNSAAVSTYA